MCIWFPFSFSSLPPGISKTESSQEIILYFISVILKICLWGFSVRLKLCHTPTECEQPTRRMSHLSPCASLSRLNILPPPPVLWGMSWTCSILLVYCFLAQEETAPLLSGQPGLQGLFKMPAWLSDEVTSLCHRQIPNICLAEEFPDKLGMKRFINTKPHEEVWPWWFLLKVWFKSCCLSVNFLIL